MNYKNFSLAILNILGASPEQKEMDDLVVAYKKDLKEERGKETETETEIIENIFNVISKIYDIPVEAIKGISRKQEIVDARHFSMYFIHEFFPKKTLKEVAVYFNGKNGNPKDHSSIINAYKNISNWCETSPSHKNKYDEIKDKLEL